MPTKQIASDTETAWTPAATPKPLRPLTRKQKAFVQHLIENPKASATQAAAQAYGKQHKPVTYQSARMIASENLTKPSILLELSKYSSTAENTIIEVMNRSKQMMYTDTGRAVDWASNARQTADSLLDRIHGKATTKIEQSTTAVTLNIDLTATTDTTE